VDTGTALVARSAVERRGGSIRATRGTARESDRADPDNFGVLAACDYVLEHSQASNGGFGASGVQMKRLRRRLG